MTTDTQEETTAIERFEGAGITPYGRRAEIRELVQRLKLMAPGGMKLTHNEALALAQYAYSMGLNPLRGEVWFLKNEKTGEQLGMMVGIAGYRRKAQEQSKEKGSDYWPEFEQITDPDERRALLIPDGALAYRCKLYETHKVRAYGDTVERLSKAKAPWSDIRAIVGTKPYIEGIGFVKKEEMQKLEKGRLQMPHAQRAMKRAEAHAIKQGFHIPFGFTRPEEGGEMLLDEYIVEGTFAELPETEEEVTAEAEKATEELFDDSQEKKIQWPRELIDWVRSDAVSVVPPDTHDRHVYALLDLWPFKLDEKGTLITAGGQKVTKPMAKFWLREYRAARDQDEKVQPSVEGASAAWEEKYGPLEAEQTDESDNGAG